MYILIGIFRLRGLYFPRNPFLGSVSPLGPHMGLTGPHSRPRTYSIVISSPEGNSQILLVSVFESGFFFLIYILVVL